MGGRVAQEAGSHRQLLHKVFSNSQWDREKGELFELLRQASAESPAALGIGAALNCKRPVYQLAMGEVGASHWGGYCTFLGSL